MSVRVSDFYEERVQWAFENAPSDPARRKERRFRSQPCAGCGSELGWEMDGLCHACHSQEVQERYELSCQADDVIEEQDRAGWKSWYAKEER